jgi:hypothetical protein
MWLITFLLGLGLGLLLAAIFWPGLPIITRLTTAVGALALGVLAYREFVHLYDPRG